MNQRIWLITGISSGLGKAMAKAVIEHGDVAVGTFRSQSQADDFNRQHADKGFAFTLDITRPEEIDAVVAATLDRFKRIDVLVNNAGYGFAGAIEETSMEEARTVFETNFFGTLSMTKAVLPFFRTQRSGHIIQISSHGGFKASPGFGIYNAAKFAVEGFSEALAQELQKLNVRLTIVEPGPFRTDFAGRSLHVARTILHDYHETAGAFRQRLKEVDGKQEGDPVKAATIIVDMVNKGMAPMRLPLGAIALQSLNAKLQSVSADLAQFKQAAESAVF
jgi:NAD(P)-dependent dehydrogenase (short-subunit alcohol dehydrogenase family)